GTAARHRRRGRNAAGRAATSAHRNRRAWPGATSTHDRRARRHALSHHARLLGGGRGRNRQLQRALGDAAGSRKTRPALLHAAFAALAGAASTPRAAVEFLVSSLT